jgi:hypothetical protein
VLVRVNSWIVYARKTRSTKPHETTQKTTACPVLTFVCLCELDYRIHPENRATNYFLALGKPSGLDLFHEPCLHAPFHTATRQTVIRLETKGVHPMLEDLWNSFIMLIPVFVLLTMIFGAGFYIGRVSKKSE